MIDCNHANSGKKPFEQARILKEVLHSCRYNPKVKKLVKGFMVESYIEDGNQPVGGGVYGKSITDARIGWQKTEKLIYDMAEAAVSGKHEEKKNVLFCNVLAENRRINASVAVKYR